MRMVPIVSRGMTDLRMGAAQCRSGPRRLTGAPHRFLLDREGECQAGAQLGFRMTVDPGLAHADVEGELVRRPPDRPGENGKTLGRIELPLVSHLRHRAHGPIVWAFHD